MTTTVFQDPRQASAGPDEAPGETPGVLAGVDRAASGRAVWAALGDAGALASVYRGGDPRQPVDVRAFAALLERVDGAVAVGSTLVVTIQLATALPLLAAAADAPGASPQLAAVVEEALAGRVVIALAATDQGAGSDLSALQTTLDVRDGDLAVDGSKRWIAGATDADHLLVLARRRPGTHFSCYSWVLVPAGAAGVTVEPAPAGLFAGSGTGHIRLRDVRVPLALAAGRPGRGMLDFAAHIAVERLAGALWAVALCRRVLADTKRLLEQREVAGAPLWQVPDVRRRVAASALRVRQLHALTRELAERAASRRDPAAAAALKATAAEVIDVVLGECAHLQGAQGFADDGVQVLRAQGALWGIGGGTSEIVLGVVADQVDELLAELRWS